MTSISLSKGQSISLSKGGNLSRVRVGLGWDPNPGAGDFDLDASAFGLARGRIFSPKYFVFYGNPASPERAIYSTGDNLTGEGDGDDEEIVIDLTTLHPEVDAIAISVSIYESVVRRQNFGHVRNAYIRVINEENGAELAKYDLTENYSHETAVVMGQVYRTGSDWRFEAISKPFAGGLAEIATQYGLDVTAE